MSGSTSTSSHVLLPGSGRMDRETLEVSGLVQQNQPAWMGMRCRGVKGSRYEGDSGASGGCCNQARCYQAQDWGDRGDLGVGGLVNSTSQLGWGCSEGGSNWPAVRVHDAAAQEHTHAETQAGTYKCVHAHALIHTQTYPPTHLTCS